MGAIRAVLHKVLNMDHPIAFPTSISFVYIIKIAVPVTAVPMPFKRVIVAERGIFHVPVIIRTAVRCFKIPSAIDIAAFISTAGGIRVKRSL